MDAWCGRDEQEPDEELPIGRPRPEPPDLVMARQLVSAYTLARTPDDRAYAAEEAETYVDLHGGELSEAALATFLELPATESTLLVLDAVANALADRAAGVPTVIGRLLRLSIARNEPARANAEVVLGRVSAAHLAAGLIAVLADPAAGSRLKGAAAEAVVALGRPAAAQILDALAEPEPRAWIVEAAGCSPAAGDAEVMRRIAAQPVED